jgi:L-amino acid N-acyltransferase YncA
MIPRYEYLCKLSAVPSVSTSIDALPGVVRHPVIDDAEKLAALMLDAYRDTIDYDGETLDDARSEINSYLRQQNNPPLLACSWLCAEHEQLLAASLVCYWSERAAPLIAYVMTRAAYKQQALGRRLVQHSLLSLHQAGYAEVWAVITAGNIPSERLFDRLHFIRQPQL